MLAVFHRSVAKCPEAMKCTNSESTPSSVLRGEPLRQYFSSLHPNSVSVNLGSSGFMAYSSHGQNPLLPRLFTAVDDIFCLFQGHIENVAPLKQQYGLTKIANEVSIIIEAYRTPRDRHPYPSPTDHVVRNVNGKFAFILFDSTSKTLFTAGDADENVPLFWGMDSEDNLVLSSDELVVKNACGRSFAPFPKGCFFTSSGGLRSFDCPIKELKPVPWTDSFGEVCGSTFEVDEESKKEIRVLRVESATNWSQYSQKL